MIEEVKRVIVEDIQPQYDRLSQELREKSNAINDLKIELARLEEETSYPVLKKHFNFIQRVLTRRNEYRNYREKEEKYNRDSKKAEEIRIKLNMLKKELEELGLKEKVDSLEEKLNKIKSVKVIKELGIDIFSAIKLLEDKGIPIVLTEADKVITEIESDYSSKSELIGVHKTRFAPIGAEIKTSKDAKVLKKRTITINNQELEYEIFIESDTVHMAMNDEVSSHMYGSWENCKYAILIPMADIPNDKIGYTSTVDTFTKGSLSLSPNCWILCPTEEVEQMKINNPNIYVIGYEGKSVLGYSAPFLSTLGYRAESVGMWSWSDDKSAMQFACLMEREGIPIGTHSSTYFREDEKILIEINQIVSVCRLLKNKRLLESPNDVPKMCEEIKEQIPLIELCTGSRFKNGEHPEAIKGNHRQLDVFFSRMEENGFTISDTYKEVIRSIDNVGLYNIRGKEIRKIINGLTNVSKEESIVLDELYASVSGLDKRIGADYTHCKPIEKFIATAVLDSVAKSKEKGLENEVNNGQEELEI